MKDAAALRPVAVHANGRTEPLSDRDAMLMIVGEICALREAQESLTAEFRMLAAEVRKLSRVVGESYTKAKVGPPSDC